ncbi:MAG: hypothetical protein R6V12_09185, partial [Candidatus Hydrogenedentota bacterium]
VFGHPLQLPPKASREAQRALDFKLVEIIAENVTVNATQIVAGILYLRALHGLPETISRKELEETARTILQRTEGRYVDPDALEDLPAQVTAALRCFKKAGLVRLSGKSVQFDKNKILATPPGDRTFRKLNPVKYSLNQILHFTDVTRNIEDAVLRP